MCIHGWNQWSDPVKHNDDVVQFRSCCRCNKIVSRKVGTRYSNISPDDIIKSLKERTKE